MINNKLFMNSAIPFSRLVRSIAMMPYIMIIVPLMLISCSGNDKKEELKPKKVPMVKIQEVTTSKMVLFTEVSGTIQANVFTDIKSSADGIVEVLTARENDRVVEGKVIAVINPNDRVNIISNNSLLVEKLTQKLKNTNLNSVEYTNIQTELTKAKSDLEYAKRMYQTIPVICPMNGIVTRRLSEKGSQVSAKETILTISDMNSLVLKAEVNEAYFEAIKQGKKIPVKLNAYPYDSITGIISLVYPEIDAQTRTVKFDVKLLQFKKKIQPGMMGMLKIPVSVKEKTMAVPEQAVLTSPDNKKFVFVVNADSIALKRVVKTGIIMGNKLEITEGLLEKDQLVVAGQEMLKDSLKVKVAGNKTPKK